MKRLKITLLLLACYASVIFASDFQEGGMYFTITGASTVEIAPKSAYEYTNGYSGTVVIPQTVEHGGTVYSVTGIAQRCFSTCASLFGVVIPEGITYIGMDAFRSDYNLVNIEFPKSLESIGNMAFEGSGISSVVIPDKVQVIGNMTFSKCYNLSSITLGKGVHTIEQNAFYSSPNLGEITVLNTTPPQLHERGFSNWNATIYVPAESVERYRMADQWNRFPTINPLQSEEETEGLVVKFYTSTSFAGIDDEVTVGINVENATEWTVEWTLPEGVSILEGDIESPELTVLTETEGQKVFTVKVVGADGQEVQQTRRLFDVLSEEGLEAITNVAQNKSIHSFSGSQANSTKETPDYLIDGETSPADLSLKWCNDATNHWAIIDLEGLYELYSFSIYDCKAGRENYENINNYRIYVSTDAENWDLVVDATDRAADNIKNDYIPPTRARYIRFNPYAKTSFTIRVWEFEAYGVEVSNNMKVTAPEPTIVKGGEQTTLTFAYDLRGDSRAADFFGTATSDSEYITINDVTDDAENSRFLVSITASEVFGYASVTLTANNGGARRSANASLTIDSDAPNAALATPETYEEDGKLWIVASANSNPWKVAKIETTFGSAEPTAVSYLLSNDKEQWTEVFSTDDIDASKPLAYILPQYRDAMYVAAALTLSSPVEEWNGSLNVYEQLPDGIKEQEPLAIASGWNADVIAETLPASEHTTNVLDDQGWVLYTDGVFNEGGLPADGVITAASGNIFQISDVKTNNAVCLKQANAPVTLTFATPQQATEVQLLSISANGESKLLVSVNYEDGTTKEETFSIADWWSNNSGQGEALYGLSRVITRREADWVADDKDYRNQFRLFEQDITTDVTKVITSITFTSTKSGSYPTVIAISRTGHSVATGIADELKADNKNQPMEIYDLQGRRIQGSNLSRGIYIVGGKKILFQ